jgi:2-methylcitrate dehydratase PrpD
VSQHARLVFMDTIGCMLAGRRAPEVAALEAQLGALEPGGFPMPGGRPLGARAACQLLAIGSTWHEACEGHAYAHGRPASGSRRVPARPAGLPAPPLPAPGARPACSRWCP